MKKALSFSIKTILMVIFTILTIASCIYDPNMTTNQINSGSTDGNQITALSVVLQNAKDGDVINLSQYENMIFDDATINKSITIDAGGKSLSSVNLKVVSDGVTLTGVNSASVTTNSSMKISGSNLSSLSIANISSSNANQIVSRGEAETNKTPKIILEGSSVGDVTVSIPKTFLSIGKTLERTSSVSSIMMAAKDAQLSVTDKNSTIDEIKFQKQCQIVLEDGTSDKIAIPVADIDAESGAAATQIDMSSGTRVLRKLSVVSGMPTVIMSDTTPDFSNLIVMGTYGKGSGMTVFTESLNYEMTESFTKMESEFTVKIDGYEYYKNGIIVAANPILSSNTHNVRITKDNIADESSDCWFEIYVQPKQTTQQKPELNSIAIMNVYCINGIYPVGHKISLKELIVVGNYVCNGTTYQSILTGWTSVPTDGQALTEGDHSITISYTDPDNKKYNSDTIENAFTVQPSVKVTIVPDLDNKDSIIERNILKDATTDEPTNIIKSGYTFDGWYKLINGETSDNTFDFAATIGESVSVYAKWNKIVDEGGNGGGNQSGDQTPDINPSVAGTYRIIFSAGDSLEYNGTMDAIDVTCDVTVDLPQCTFTIQHYTFVGWNTSKDGKGAFYADKSGVINLAAAGETVTLWAQWTENPKFFIYYHNDQDSENNSIQMVYKDVTNDEFESCQWSKDGNEFLYWTINLDTNDVTFDSGMTIDTDLTGDGGYVHLYPVWKPKTWTIEYKDQNNQPFSGSDNTSDWAQYFVYGTPVDLSNDLTKAHYNFDGWYVDADCSMSIGTINDDYVSTYWISTDTITLYAKWTPRTHSIIYMDQSGDNSWIDITETLSGAKTSFAEHEDVTIDAVASKLGYGFARWFANTTDTDSTDHWSAGDKTFDVILYAKWTQNEYTIKFNHNYDEMGVTISEPGNLIRDYGNTTDRLPTPSYSRSDYNMYGWNTSADGTGKHFEAGEILTEDLTTDDCVIVNLYAIWYSTTQAAIGDIVYDHTIDNPTNPHEYWYSLSYLQGKMPIGVVYDTESESSFVRVVNLRTYNDDGDGSSQYLVWCNTDAIGFNSSALITYNDNGYSNTNSITALEDFGRDNKYPAFEYINSLNDSSNIVWYMPAINELVSWNTNRSVINHSFALLNGMILSGNTSIPAKLFEFNGETRYYWSSTVLNENLSMAYYYNGIEEGLSVIKTDPYTCTVRAATKIQLP